MAERSAINGSVFNTDFNNGHGMQYFLNGQVSRDMEWSNMNLQDFMPTWQWWVESEGTTALNLDWDYGEKQEKVLLDGTTGSFDYKQIGAYNGGSSLAIYGDLEAGKKQTVNLYKTDLQVLEGSKLSLTPQNCMKLWSSMQSSVGNGHDRFRFAASPVHFAQWVGFHINGRKPALVTGQPSLCSRTAGWQRRSWSCRRTGRRSGTPHSRHS